MTLVVRVLLGVGCAFFAFYAGRRYEREEWEIVSWENGNLRERNSALSERADKSERLAHEKAQQNAKLRQSLLSYRLQLMRDRN